MPLKILHKMQQHSHVKRREKVIDVKKKWLKLYPVFLYSRSFLFHTHDSIGNVTTRCA